MNDLRTPSVGGRTAPSRRAQRGVSMIELLVALLIFSFGMLGLAGLQLRTMAYSQSSLFRSQAMALTDDVLDRMRAVRGTASASTGGWNTELEETGESGSDLADWKSEVASLLPSGQASISVSTAKVVTVTIQWLDSPDKDTNNLTTFTTVSAL